MLHKQSVFTVKNELVAVYVAVSGLYVNTLKVAQHSSIFSTLNIFEVVVSPGVLDTGIVSGVPLQVYKVTGLVLKSTDDDGPKKALVQVSRQVSPGHTSF